MASLLILLFSYSSNAFARDCGPIPPGASFGEGCKVVPIPAPVPTVAVIVGEVVRVECGGGQHDWRAYTATVRLKKVLHNKTRGTVPKELKLRFTRYFDDSGDLPRGPEFTLSQGEVAEISLMRNSEGWAVNADVPKRVIRNVVAKFPYCEPQRGDPKGRR